MENTEINNRDRQQLSSDLFLPTIAICVFLFFLFLLLSDYRRVELSTVISYIILFITLAFLLIYILRRPGIYFDSTNLYIKSIKGKENTISFSQLESINQTFFNYGFSNSNYFSMYKIKYRNKGSLLSFKVIVNNAGNPIAKFQKAVEAINPKVTI